MTEIICAVITALGAVIVAAVGRDVKKRNEKEEERDEKRRKESHLQLAMIAANTSLTIGVAMALKNGHCNGEVEEGLQEVRDAKREYQKFLAESGLDSVR